MILVTFAVPFESAAFRRRAAARGVRILHTGVGEEAARAALEAALCGELPERVISSGFAGALAPGFGIGEIVSGEAGRWRRAEFATSAEVLATVAAKRDFRARTGAEIVDMETAAIREACAVAEVPLRTLRAISDGAEDELGLPPELLERLAAAPVRSAPRLLWTLMTSGAASRGAFVRMVFQARRAQAALAEAIEHELAR